MKAKGSAIMRIRYYPAVYCINAMVHMNGVIGSLHPEFVTNASHDHDSLSITGPEVGDGARHMSQKYQMVKHQLV